MKKTLIQGAKSMEFIVLSILTDKVLLICDVSKFETVLYVRVTENLIERWFCTLKLH